MVTFLAVLAVLVAIAVAIGIVANMIDPEESAENPVRLAKVAARVAPVGQVYTDASQVPVPAAPVAAVQREPAEVLQAVCGACHNSGILESPKTGDRAAWEQRLKAVGGMDALVASAIAGKGAMPARGGDPSLSDETIRKVVELMVK